MTATASRRTPLALLALVALAAGCASGGGAPPTTAKPARPPEQSPRTAQPAPATAQQPTQSPLTGAPPANALSALQHDIDSMVAQPEFRNAHWGILVVDPDRGDTLYSHNAGKLFMPASNMKIITGSVALAQLGPDYRFNTAFVAAGPACGGVLHGDLLVDGRGDPSVSDAMREDAMIPMREMADSLAAHGIRTIRGRVISGFDAFPGSELGYGWSWDDLGDTYSAGVDELFFNEGYGRVVVRGGRRATSPVRITALPSAHYPHLRVDARTGWAPDTLVLARGGGGPIRSSRYRRASSDLTVLPDSLGRGMVLTGWIAPGAVDTIDVVFPDQNAAYLAALRGAIADRKIIVQNRTKKLGKCTGTAGIQALDTIFVYQSAPLRDILHAMEKPSQNQIAEILLRTLGLERAGVGRPDSGASVVERQLLAWGAEPDGFVIRDGSGLSRYDYLSPETIVRTLAAIRKDTAFSVFYDALPIAGIDGTIENRMRGTAAEGNVHAKTGSIANARSLSGYVTTADGRELIFSMLSNNWTVPARDVLRVQDAIAALLAELTTTPVGG
ncbi:MAG TPA: D-alanyl-D-alanine carboxypeptidase/D-alanyl-D-alanine-endopeptidase [Gemmatimonadaceae bacterium]|nr:D-alanyl-D-alanine carboxypeptidase/D-alanyl-D-alanine-endopeptidase [Gemmatimonadaceae bacterium]